MTVRSYDPWSQSDHIATKTDILEDWPQRIIREQMVPQIAKLTRNALNVTPVYVEHFQRIKAGRRCSCFYIESSPNGDCTICYGLGVVGGYQKRGTKVDIFDVTAPGTVCVNAYPVYGDGARPAYFTLARTALVGTIDFDWTVTKNIGVLDHLGLIGYAPDGSSIAYYVRASTDPQWVLMTEAALSQRLLIGKPLRIRVRLTRQAVNGDVPKFVGIRVSYRISKLSAIRADIPRTQRSRTLEEYGFYDSFNAQTFVFENAVKALDNSDFFCVLQDGTRWKVTEWQDNRILGINTSWDVTCRLVQSDMDGFASMPMGRFDMPEGMMPPNAVRSIQTENELMSKFQSKGGAVAGREPGMRADIDSADNLAVGVSPGQTVAVKPPSER